MTARTLMLIRHAEKPERSAGIGGVRLDGSADEQDLSVKGWQRAGALVRLFAPVRGDLLDPRLARPASIFAAASRGKSTRPLHTVEPLAEALGLQVCNDHSSEGPIKDLVTAALDCSGPVLISWRHATLPLIARQLVGRGNAPDRWHTERFDLVWVLRELHGSWTFEQVPQRVLPDDVAQPD